MRKVSDIKYQVSRRFQLAKSIALYAFVTLLVSCASKKQVDLIVFNANIYTVDSSFSNAESFAVKDGKFIAVGTTKEILEQYEAKETIDAQGKAVYPGFIDSHCHFYGYGQGLQEVDLVGTKSFNEVLTRVQLFQFPEETMPPTAWIIGRGWDQNDWDVKEYPSRKELDSLFPTNPVFIERIDGHAALANKAALIAAHINVDTKVSGGVIEIQNGALTGILIDNAVDLLKKAIPSQNFNGIKQSLLAAQKNCFQVGLTTVDDAGLEKNIVEIIDSLQKSGELKMRIYAMLSDNAENAAEYLRSKKNSTYHSERLHVCSFKFYADGALGSRGACLISPYTDKPEQRGFLLNTPQHFDSLAKLMMLRGFQMNTHCIGDSAVKLISAICRNYNYQKNTDNRWRIEHFQVATKKDIAAVKDNHIIPSVQPTHATSDMYWAKDRLGNERIKNAYAYNDLLKAAGKIALGTDFPVENINPMYTFYAAVARKDLKGQPEGGFQMENALSRENTLRGMTIWGAYANFEEHEKGSIEVGKFADFVILENDIMKCDIDKVPTTKVNYTYINGEKVFH